MSLPPPRRLSCLPGGFKARELQGRYYWGYWQRGYKRYLFAFKNINAKATRSKNREQRK